MRHSWLGWDAFDRQAPAAARALIDDLTANPEPLLAALARLPAAGLHGDLKLGNVGLASDGRVWLIDWQMTLVAPVAVELGWFLVNVAGLPLGPDDVLEGYRVAAGIPADDAWAAQRDLAILVGLVLRGWRKGLDAEAVLELPTGVTATDDLAWWCERAVAAEPRSASGRPSVVPRSGPGTSDRSRARWHTRSVPSAVLLRRKGRPDGAIPAVVGRLLRSGNTDPGGRTSARAARSRRGNSNSAQAIAKTATMAGSAN